MISIKQIKAARGLLDWEKIDLAKWSGLTPRTIGDVESGQTQRKSTLEKIEETFSTHGVEFTDNNGVREARGIEVFSGQKRFNEFMAYLVKCCKERGGEVRVSVTDERIFQKHIENIEVFRSEMVALDKAKRIRGYILATEGNFVRTWADIRQAPKTSHAAPVSFYVFGDNFALVSFAEKEPYVELHRASPFAADFCRLFDLMWESAVPA